ncbi:MAG: hypothetical protein HC866_16315 [Leptolyngbyaceae cyanobacterium RU_5_1]|nr:hypothetical protein [Leptolyngbyaceae cyanobacterium RU_5_1]
MKPSSGDTQQVTNEPDFEQELAGVERSLQALKNRYLQVQRDQQTQAHLRSRKEQIKRPLQHAASSELNAELKQIQAQLDELEFNLESRLFTWGSLKEPFWQIIRFSGLGMILGWFLAFVLLSSPNPIPPMPKPNQEGTSSL